VHWSHHIQLVMKTFVHLSKRMLTQVSALTLVWSSYKMKRTEQQLCPISERSLFSKKTPDSPLVVIM